MDFFIDLDAATLAARSAVNLDALRRLLSRIRLSRLGNPLKS
jgi:hypothetical protein